MVWYGIHCEDVRIVRRQVHPSDAPLKPYRLVGSFSESPRLQFCAMSIDTDIWGDCTLPQCLTMPGDRSLTVGGPGVRYNAEMSTF